MASLEDIVKMYKEEHASEQDGQNGGSDLEKKPESSVADRLPKNEELKQTSHSQFIHDDSDDEGEEQVQIQQLSKQTSEEEKKFEANQQLAEDFISRSVAGEREQGKGSTQDSKEYMSENEKYKTQLLKKALDDKKATIVRLL